VQEAYAQPALVFDVALAPLTVAALVERAAPFRRAIAALAGGLVAGGGGGYRMEQALLLRAQDKAAGGGAIDFGDRDGVNTAGNSLTDAFDVQAIWGGGGLAADSALSPAGARRALRPRAAAATAATPAQLTVTVALYVASAGEADDLGEALRAALSGSGSSGLIDGLGAAVSGAAAARRRGLAASPNVTASVDPTSVRSEKIATTRPAWRALLGWLVERQSRVLGGAVALLLLVLAGAPLGRHHRACVQLRRAKKRVFTLAAQSPSARFAAAQRAASARAAFAAHLLRVSLRRRLRILFAALLFIARARARAATAGGVRAARAAAARVAAAAKAAAAAEARAAAAAVQAVAIAAEKVAAEATAAEAAAAQAAAAAAAAAVAAVPPPASAPLNIAASWEEEEAEAIGGAPPNPPQRTARPMARALQPMFHPLRGSGGGGGSPLPLQSGARRRVSPPPPASAATSRAGSVAPLSSRRGTGSGSRAAAAGPRGSAAVPMGARSPSAALRIALAGARSPPMPLRGGAPASGGGRPSALSASRASSPRAPPPPSSKRAAPAPAPAPAPAASRRALDQLQRLATRGLPLSDSPTSDDA
jgi:hypothetical protein